MAVYRNESGASTIPYAVVCDGCGGRVYDGYRSYIEQRDTNGVVVAFSLGNEHYCDECMEKAGENVAEFRTCDYCGKPFSEGYTVEGGGWYCCEDCFKPMLERDYPDGYRPNEHEDDPHWCGGMWDYKSADGKWHDTGVFYTEWF